MNQVVLGICQCDTKQHGQFDGQIISLAGQDFQVRERIIIFPALANSRFQLTSHRCNFFLDSHLEKTGIHNTKLSARIVYQQLEHAWEYQPTDLRDWCYRYYHQWMKPRIPLPETVLKRMSRLYSRLPPEWQHKLLAAI